MARTPEVAALVAALDAVARGEDPDVDPLEAFDAAFDAARVAGTDPYELVAPVSPVEVIATNLKALRTEAGWSQPRLADAMVEVGFPVWTRQTVAEIERYARRVSWEEIWALALIFSVPIAELIAPAGGEDVQISDKLGVEDIHAVELVVGRDGGRAGRIGTGGPAWRPALHTTGQFPSDALPSKDLWQARNSEKER